MDLSDGWWWFETQGNVHYPWGCQWAVPGVMRTYNLSGLGASGLA